MHRVLVQYERLRRHYQHVEKTYDYASFLDLSHILRIWVELKVALPKIDKTFTAKKLFKSAVPNRKILKAYNNVEYIVAFLPDGVTTHVGNKKMIEWNEREGAFSIGATVAQKDDWMKMTNFHFCFPNAEPGTKSITENPKISRLNLVEWFGAEIIRMNFKRANGQLETISIPREILIKRLANILDGSHTSLETSGDFDNKFDEPIKFLMDFKCAGCPIPYYLLLKVAQDIVEFGPKLLEQIKNT